MRIDRKQLTGWLRQRYQQIWTKPFARSPSNRYPFGTPTVERRAFDRRVLNQHRWRGLPCKRSLPIKTSDSSRRFGLWSGFAVAALSTGLYAIGGWHVLELQSYNLLHRTRRTLAGAPNWDDRIAVITIDDASTAELGRYPWPRQTYTDLLEKLWSTQPAAISFDIVFSDATEEDSDLANAIMNSANVVLAVAGGDRDSAPISISPSIAEPAEGFFLSGDISNRADIDGISRRLQLYIEDSTDNKPNPSLSVATLQVYAETMSGTTQADLSSVADVSVSTHHSHRSAKTHFSAAPRYAPSGRQLADSIEAVPPFELTQSSSFEAPLFDRLSGRIPRGKTLWISWPGEVSSQAPDKENAALPVEGRLQTYSYVDVLKGRVPISRFQNKIVLIGATGRGIDPLRTPFHAYLPTAGVYLHAATIDNLLNQSFLKSPPKWQAAMLLAILAIASAPLLQRQGVYLRLAILVGFPVAWSGFAYSSFLLGWWLPVAAPIGTVALTGLVIQLREQQEKQQLMDIFSMNVSPGTAELIWQHKDAILHRGKLSAQTLTATVLFMDIRGFSSTAETLPSQQLLPWLNQYFETMTDCIMAHGGMVDKYIGDAIMAVFGAPLPRTTPEEVQADAIAALSAAIEMHERLAALNLHLERQDLPTIDFGIGIHTGPLIGGTVGSRHRLNYSVFGDTVNIAARLESMTKQLPKSAPFKILVSSKTCQHVQPRFPFELFCSSSLRGRQSTTDIYALVNALASAPSPAPPPTVRTQPVADTHAVSA